MMDMTHNGHDIVVLVLGWPIDSAAWHVDLYADLHVKASIQGFLIRARVGSDRPFTHDLLRAFGVSV